MQAATNVGDVDKAFAGAAKTLSATYQSDFQSHASMAGACAVAYVQGNTCRVWTGGRKPYGTVNTIADLLGIPKENIRSTYYVGPGSYGRNDADDAALEAAFLSQQVGAPSACSGCAARRPAGTRRARRAGRRWTPRSTRAARSSASAGRTTRSPARRSPPGRRGPATR